MDEVVPSAAGFTLGVPKQRFPNPIPGLSFLFTADLPSQRVKRSRSDPGRGGGGGVVAVGAPTPPLLKCCHEVVCKTFLNDLTYFTTQILNK